MVFELYILIKQINLLFVRILLLNGGASRFLRNKIIGNMFEGNKK